MTARTGETDMSEIGIGVTRLEGESWRDCVKRYASKYGLEVECLQEFDNDPDPNEARRAWGALLEWDIGDYYRGEA